jgi:hypothetical protein
MTTLDNIPRTFKLVRIRDVSGVSGTGVVAEGIVFHDGQVALSWFGKYHSLEIHPSLQQVLDIHGHDGATVAVGDRAEE